MLALADWLRSWQVPAVVMEATGDYWKPVFFRLEAEGFDCVLCRRHSRSRTCPGGRSGTRRTPAWLAKCFERGALTACFVATEEFRHHPAAHPVPAAT